MQIIHHGNNCGDLPQRDPETGRIIYVPRYVYVHMCRVCEARFTVTIEEYEESLPHTCPCCASPRDEFELLTPDPIDDRLVNNYRF